MNTDAKDLFARAHELAGEERQDFLSEACGDDAELRLEVQRLLVQAEKADSFFADDAGATIGADTFDAACTEAEGDEIGPYTLRQQIGEGGFGIVWMAEQTGAIQRMVALKVVKAGMDTRQVLARFEAERQALAMMDHPNIAKVLDAGATPAGRPYFAMELVKGIPITEFCDQQKFGPRRRLELFKDVCSAVNHAHQKGIIHRDLKPSNIMVTLEADRPVVKVIDFGIAKATHSKLTEKTLFTRFEQFLGTPVYMSPEQAAMSNLDVDTRSDIYSLGVLLYELLAGAPPFDQKSLLSAGYDEMRRIIAEDEPPKPSTRCTQTKAGDATTTGSKPKKFHVSASVLKGELDWIVMKAIEKDRTRRYETANAFAEDIGRFLADEPVQAAAPSASYKFRKFARRNKAAFGVAAAMVALLLSGIAATSWQAVRATKAEELAITRLEEAEVERNNAREISKFVTGLLQSPDPARDGRRVTVMELLDDAARKLGDLADQPERRATLEMTLGETYRALGIYGEAIPLLERSRARFADLLGEAHGTTLSASTSLASAYAQAGRDAEALPLFEMVYEMDKERLGPDHPDTWRAATNLASTLLEEGRPEEAHELQVWALAKKKAGLGNGDRDTWTAMMTLANILENLDAHAEALDLRQRVYELTLQDRGPKDPETIGHRLNLATSHHRTGGWEKAEAIYSELTPLCEDVFGTDHHTTLKARTNHGRVLGQLGRLEGARVMQRETVRRKKGALPCGHPDTIKAMLVMADLLEQSGQWDEAVEVNEELCEMAKPAFGAHDRRTIALRAALATARQRAGDWDTALTELEAAQTDAFDHLGKAHPATVECTLMLAGLYQHFERDSRAIEVLERVWKASSEQNGAESPLSLALGTNLGLAQKDAGLITEATRVLREVFDLRRGREGANPHDIDFLGSQTNLAIVLSLAGETDEARRLLEDAVRLKRQHHGDHEFFLVALAKLAPLRFDDGDYEGTVAICEEWKNRSNCCPDCETAKKMDDLIVRSRHAMSPGNGEPAGAGNP